MESPQSPVPVDLSQITDGVDAIHVADNQPIKEDANEPKVAQKEPPMPEIALKAALTIQSVWRARNARKYAKSVHRRLGLCTEIRDNERLYVSNIAYICVLYEQPLRDLVGEGKPVIDGPTITSIFQDIQSIVKVHTSFSSAISKRMKRWNHDSCLGDIFSEYAPQFTALYTQYVLNFSSAMDIFNSLLKTNSAFKAFVRSQRSTDPNLQSLTIEDLLMMPVQRIPRYELLLNGVLKHTVKSHPDYVLLQDAIAAIKKLASSINDAKSVLEVRHRVSKLLLLLEDLDLPEKAERAMIAEIQAIEMVRKENGKVRKPRTVFVFSDFLLCAKSVQTVSSDLVGEANFHLKWLVSRNRSSSTVAYERDMQEWVRGVETIIARIDEANSQQKPGDNSPLNRVISLGRRRGRSMGNSHTLCFSGDELITWLSAEFGYRKEDTVVLCQEMLDRNLIAPAVGNVSEFLAGSVEYKLTGRPPQKVEDPLMELREQIEEVKKSIVIERRISAAAEKLVDHYKGINKVQARRQCTQTTRSLDALKKQLQDLQESVALHTPNVPAHIRTRSADGAQVFVHTLYFKDPTERQRAMDVINSNTPLSPAPSTGAIPTTGPFSAGPIPVGGHHGGISHPEWRGTLSRHSSPGSSRSVRGSVGGGGGATSSMFDTVVRFRANKPRKPISPRPLSMSTSSTFRRARQSSVSMDELRPRESTSSNHSSPLGSPTGSPIISRNSDKEKEKRPMIGSGSSSPDLNMRRWRTLPDNSTS